MVKAKLDILIPKVPNFLRISNCDGHTISVAKLSDEDLRAVGEQWTQDLIDRAVEVRSQSIDP